MKSTARGSLAALLTCAAAAAAATPAAAAEQVPVPVPLDGVEQVFHLDAPDIGAGLPVPVTGTPETPRYVQGRLLPEHTLPRVPVDGGLPAARVATPLPKPVGAGRSGRLSLSEEAAPLDTTTPGATLDAPLTPPRSGPRHGLPDLKLPQAAVLAPLLRTRPGAELGLS